MNERIKELAEKATKKMTGDNNTLYDVLYAEKFAELIVKDCLKEIKDMLVEESELLYPNNHRLTTHHVNNRLLDAYDNISELFGVKE